MVNKDRWAIIGGGNGGQALAAFFSIKGKKIRLYDVFDKTVELINEAGGVELEGDIEGFGEIEFATTDMQKAISSAKVIWVILPSIYHKSIAATMAPYLEDGQIIILSPVAALGTMEFENSLKENGCSANVVLSGTCTLLFACRMQMPGKVTVNGKKKWLTIAAYPASYNNEVQREIGEYVPEFEFVDNIIKVFLDNKNYAVHPGPTLLYAGMIENGVDFEYYINMGKTQVKLVESIDRESIKIAEAYGINDSLEITEFCKKTYGYEGDSFYELLTTADCYKGISGPKTLSVRYLQEDIPYALKGIQALGKAAGIDTPAIDAVITLAYTLKGDELDNGRSLENLGLAGIDRNELLERCRG